MNTTLEPVPASSEFAAIWSAYALFALGAAMFWPALIGALVCLVKRDASGAGFIGSHHAWLLRTFGWSLLIALVAFGVIIAGAWPLVQEAIRAAHDSGDWPSEWSIGFRWESIFLTAGIASAGALALAVNWCWYLYRLIRGAVRLSANRAI
jgi:uncharacterized membrane protein